MRAAQYGHPRAFRRYRSFFFFFFHCSICSGLYCRCLWCLTGHAGSVHQRQCWFTNSLPPELQPGWHKRLEHERRIMGITLQHRMGGSRLHLFCFFFLERRGAGAWGSMLPWNRIQIKTTSSEHNGQSWMLPHSYLSGNVKIQPNDFNALQTSRARKPFFFFFSRRIYIFPCKHCIIKARKATFQSSVLSFKRIPFTSSQCWHRRRSD